jgi:glutamate synthase (NADPH/NADH) large chain
MIGRADCLEMRPAIAHWKAHGVDLEKVLHLPDMPAVVSRRAVIAQEHGLERSLDVELIARASAALERGEPVQIELAIRNEHRTVGTMLGSEVTRRYGGDGLPEDTIGVRFTGSAGQSFGAFVPHGVTLSLEGDANDFFGKGLSGGKLVVYPPRRSTFAADQNVIVGNVCLYGATSGEAYVRGIAGERFAVRNSGAHAVVEGVGDHGCEYMTAGRVVVLGRTGRNFAAGMSGGIAYVLDVDGGFARRCNTEMVDLEPLIDGDDAEFVRSLLRRHVRYTNSERAGRLLEHWAHEPARFVKVIPRDYRRVVEAEARARAENREPAFAELVGAANG